MVYEQVGHKGGLFAKKTMEENTYDSCTNVPELLTKEREEVLVSSSWPREVI